MRKIDIDIRTLSNNLIDEIVNAVGLRKTPAARRAFNLFFSRITERVSAIGLAADKMIAAEGFPAAAGWTLNHWVKKVTRRGAETIPAAGPLLVVANHVGAYDFLIIPSQLGRADLKIISSNIPFLKYLPNAGEHLIFAPNTTQGRMSAARAGLRHLDDGGSLLLFGTGLVDPDPAVYPGAEKAIERWSPSIDLFLRQQPKSNILLTIVSGVISPKWAYHPITRLRKIDWQKRRLAEFAQIIQQLLSPGKLNVTPQISFAPPATTEALHHESDSGRLLPAVIARGKSLLAEHMEWIRKIPET